MTARLPLIAAISGGLLLILLAALLGGSAQFRFPGWYVTGGLLVLAILALAIQRGWLSGVGQMLKHGPATPEHAEQARTQSAWIARAAYLPEALSVALTLSWAWSAQDNQLIRWIFAAAFAGFVVFKVHSVPAAVNAWRFRDWGVFAITALLALGSVLTLFGSSIFELVNESGDDVQARIESSRPAEALDAQIALAQEKLQALSGYADAGQADAEARNIEQAKATRQARIRELQSQIQAALSAVPLNSAGKPAGKSLASLASHCGPGYTGHYAGQCEAVRQLRAELESLQGKAGGAGVYGAKFADYTGTKAHLAELLKQRATLSESGQGVQSAYRPEDRLLASWFGVDPESASWGKWFAYALIFDLASLIARIAAQMLLNAAGGNPRRELMRKVDAMLVLGIDPLAALAGSQPTSMPAYRYGGIVDHHGPAEMHGTPDAPEYVLSPEMTQAVGGPDVLEALRRKVHDAGAPPSGRIDGAPYVTAGRKEDTARRYDSAPSTTAGREYTTDTPGKGRIGKWAHCQNCGAEYQVKSWNAITCQPDCRAQHNGFPDIEAAKRAANRARRK